MTTTHSIVEVELTDAHIVVEWSDGRVSVYDPREVRINCGCAQCVEEWSRRKLLDPATVPHDIRAEDYLMVGKYAVQFLWSDGHYTGIYTFETMRRLGEGDERRAGSG